MDNLEKVGLFIGDGKHYDATRSPEAPIRIGSILYQVVPYPEVGIEPTGEITDTIDNE